jgi:hypothetical protein
MSKNTSGRKLPSPNAQFRSPDQMGNMAPADIRGMICNPVYAGLGPFPQMVSDEEWVAAAAMFIKKEGTEQFLVNLLHVLRQTFPQPSG